MLEFILLGLIAVPLITFGSFYYTYNQIVALDQRCDQADHDIDIQLKYRHELIPNLVGSVRGFVDHENRALEAVLAARKGALCAATPDAQMQAEAALGDRVGQLVNLVEAYPQLKASKHFQALRRELSDCEHKIAASRRFYNLAIREYNTAVSQYPGRKIAPLFRLHARQFLDMSADRVFFEDAPVVKF